LAAYCHISKGVDGYLTNCLAKNGTSEQEI
jgi:hypothetical protein